MDHPGAGAQLRAGSNRARHHLALRWRGQHISYRGWTLRRLPGRTARADRERCTGAGSEFHRQGRDADMTALEPPMAVLAELTHRCPLQCPYCSNPLKLERPGEEMPTADWLRAIREAAALGCLQVHFSGGEPTTRKDLEELVAGASEAGLYTNLITSG